MSGHRVELKISFFVGDEDARDDAAAVVRYLKATGEALCYVGPLSEFTVVPLTVDGNGWNEKWGDSR